MRYLILSQASTDYAAAMSRALYALSAPPGSETTFAVGWVKDAEGRVALDLGVSEQYLQPTADIQAFVQLLPIPDADKAAVAAHLVASTGQRLRYADMLQFAPTLAAALTDAFDPGGGDA